MRGCAPSSGPDGFTYTAELEIDPEAIRRQRAESAIAVGEIMRKPVTMEEALSEQEKDEISGTMKVTLITDGAGDVHRKTTVVSVNTKKSSGEVETETTTTTWERRLLSRSSM